MTVDEDMQNVARNHLLMIEHTHGIKIRNLEELAGWITGLTEDNRLILTIAFSLNHWVAVNSKQGEIEVPRSILDRIVRAAK